MTGVQIPPLKMLGHAVFIVGNQTVISKHLKERRDVALPNFYFIWEGRTLYVLIGLLLSPPPHSYGLIFPCDVAEALGDC